jgi:hypothetical protein
MPDAGTPHTGGGLRDAPAATRLAASKAALLLWNKEGKWADVALEGVSMDPIIRDGARLRVRFGACAAAGEPAGSDLKVGDVVIYAAPARLIAHRVIRVGRRGRRAGWVRVKGDPLTSRKATWIRASEILGRVAAVTQPDGTRLYLNTPAGRLLNRGAAWISMTVGAIDARLPRRAPVAPSESLTGRALHALDTIHRAAQRRAEAKGGDRLSPEERFLVTACRPRLTAEDLDRIAGYGTEILDWDQVREQAISLGLAPLLFRNLSDARLRGTCPETFLSRLGRASHIAVYLAMHRREELVRILDLLGAEGIETVLLKGAALACTVYEDPSLRTMNDLDLLMRDSEIPAAARALEALSYRQLYRASLADPGKRAAFYGGHHHATPLIAPRGRAIVELHRHIVSMGQDGFYDVEKIRTRARRIIIEGRRALVPSPADLVLHTCLHLSYSDRFVGKLRDLIDLHETISLHGDQIDWGAMLAEIPSEAAARCLYSCLDLARRLYGTPVPEDFLYELRRASRLGILGVHLLRALARTVLFQGASSSQTILTVASAKWCCDTLLRKAGWPSRLRALAVLLAEG